MNRNQNNYTDDFKGKDINLREYFIVLKKRFWIIILLTIMTTLGGYYYSTLNDTLYYQTSTRIILGKEGDMQTLMVMIKDPIIMESVRKELKLERPADRIANQIEVSRIDESQVVRIVVTDTDPQLAVGIANATAKQFKQGIVKILDFKDVQLLSEAKVNPYPINEDNNRMMIIGAVFGIITGIGLVFLLDSLDSTIRREQDVEEILDVPVLGTVRNMNKKKLLNKKRTRKETEVRSETVSVK